MAKSSSDKLAQALRANLQRRKQTKAGKPQEPAQERDAKPASKPPKIGN
jgi:hypothetical protein